MNRFDFASDNRIALPKYRVDQSVFWQDRWGHDHSGVIVGYAKDEDGLLLYEVKFSGTTTHLSDEDLDEYNTHEQV